MLTRMVWEESGITGWTVHQRAAGEDGIGISYAAKERLIAQAFTHQTVSDLEMASVQSRHAVADSKEMHSIVEGLASPKVIQHIRSLLLYIRSIYPCQVVKNEVFRRYGWESHHQALSNISTNGFERHYHQSSMNWHCFSPYNRSHGMTSRCKSIQWSARRTTPIGCGTIVFGHLN